MEIDLSKIKLMPDSEIMSAHLKYEQYKNRMIPLLNKTHNLLSRLFCGSVITAYILDFIESRIKFILSKESKLKHAAYPNINKVLSSDQMDELFEAYRGKNTADWDNEDTSYSKMYLS